MQEQLITFETAKLAKEKGFDIPCNGYNHKGIISERAIDKIFNLQYYYAPSQSLLQKWLREKKGISVDVFTWLEGDKFVYGSDIMALFPIDNEWNSMNLGEQWDTYEDALEAGLQEALKLIP